MTNDSSSSSTQQRNRPGTKRKDLYNWINKSSKFTSSSNFSTQELIQERIRLHPSKINKILQLPDEKEQQEMNLNIDESSWIYEHMRQFLLDLNAFILAHKKVCTKETQPEMKITGAKTSEDLVFLCSAFTPPQLVSAIDYMVHTVTQSAQILNNPKLFPNRISISEKGMKEIKTITRRIYRIFAFSYFVHPEQFFEFEDKTHLCERYTRFLKVFNLMQKKQFLIPDQVFKK
jgi:hypothetical protein